MIFWLPLMTLESFLIFLQHFVSARFLHEAPCKCLCLLGIRWSLRICQLQSLANQFLSIYPSLAITGGEVFFVLPHSLTPLNILLCRTSPNIFLGSFEKGEEKRHKMCFWLLNLNSYSSTCSPLVSTTYALTTPSSLWCVCVYRHYMAISIIHSEIKSFTQFDVRNSFIASARLFPFAFQCDKIDLECLFTVVGIVCELCLVCPLQ